MKLVKFFGQEEADRRWRREEDRAHVAACQAAAGLDEGEEEEREVVAWCDAMLRT